MYRSGQPVVLSKNQVKVPVPVKINKYLHTRKKAAVKPIIVKEKISEQLKRFYPGVYTRQFPHIRYQLRPPPPPQPMDCDLVKRRTEEKI